MKGDETWLKQIDSELKNFGIKNEEGLQKAAFGPSEHEQFLVRVADFRDTFRLLEKKKDDKDWMKLHEMALKHFVIKDEPGFQDLLKRLETEMKNFAIKNENELQKFADRIKKLPESFQSKLAKQNFNKMEIQDLPLDGHIVGYWDKKKRYHDVGSAFGLSFWSHAFVWRYDERNASKREGSYRDTFLEKDILAIELAPTHGVWPDRKHAAASKIQYASASDDHAHGGGHHGVRIEKDQISRLSSYEPAHSTFFATYYTLTGLHALHVLGGILVMLYHLLPISRRVYERDPERFTNRIEITGLF